MHATDDVTDNMVVRGCPGSIPAWVQKKEKSMHNIYVLFILYVIYIVYILYAYYIYIYIAYICRVKSGWYINRTSFKTYIVEPTCG